MALAVFAALEVRAAITIATRTVHSETPSPVRASATPALPRLGEVSLIDAGGTVTLSWQASAGGVRFVILAAKAGTEPVMAQLTPVDVRNATVTGLDPHANYCFRVAAVYVAGLVRSAPACTQR